MLQAITVRYKAPGNRLGARYIAFCAAKRIVCKEIINLDYQGNHLAAAHKLAVKLGWEGHFYGGVNKAGEYIFVIACDGPTNGFRLPRDA